MTGSIYTQKRLSVAEELDKSDPNPGANPRIWIMVSKLKVFQSYGLLLRNYPSQFNKLFIRLLENSPIFFGSSPIGYTKDVDATVKGAVRTLVDGI
ncbi:UNVERIFIED_CONTAM: hypothetical protein NCL1_12933 [Trichonephila clavipes]